MAPTFVALLSVLSGSLAYPSFRYKIPNGERVPCPERAAFIKLVLWWPPEHSRSSMEAVLALRLG